MVPTMKHKEQIRHIVRALTPEAIAKEVGGAPKTVLHYIDAGRFPASWYLVVTRMCLKRGIECPHALFSFKGMAA